jgi:hypothetical protein
MARTILWLSGLYLQPTRLRSAIRPSFPTLVIRAGVDCPFISGINGPERAAPSLYSDGRGVLRAHTHLTAIVSLGIPITGFPDFAAIHAASRPAGAHEKYVALKS